MSGALVTGGAAGIGWATARAFAALGDRVAILDLDGAQAATRAAELGPGHLGLGCDVTDEASVHTAVDRAEQVLGGLGAVVNNAGIGDNPAATLDQDLGGFRRVLSVHLDGTFLVSRAAARHMLPRGRGAIVNIASIAALGGLPRRNAYGAAKAGIVAMTRSMACEWAHAGIRVNAVAPGYVATELVARLADAGRARPRRDPPPHPARRASARRRRSRTRSPSSPRTLPATSPARCCRSTEAGAPSAGPATRAPARRQKNGGNPCAPRSPSSAPAPRGCCSAGC